MRNKFFSGIFCCFWILIILLGSVPLRAECREYTVDEVQGFIDGIAAYNLNISGAGSIQDWINGALTDGAGATSEWYVIALSQSGYRDFSSYEAALQDFLNNNSVASATSRQKYALALIASGSRSDYITDVLEDSIGQQGIMSWIYGLHILNNGYTCENYSMDFVVDMILSLQYDDGGWALFGENGDIDVTAMTIQALAPHYPYNQNVQYSVDRGLEFLSQRQQENGGYKSFGTPNTESAAQVLTAVSSLGIDCQSDERFIKNGNTLIDGIAEYRLPDGGFSHSAGGDFNESASTQAYYSFVAYQRMRNGQSPFLILDNKQAEEEPPIVTNADDVQEIPNTDDVSSSDNVQSTEAVSERETSAVTAVSSNTALSSTSSYTVSSSYTTVTVSETVTSGYTSSSVLTTSTGVPSFTGTARETVSSSEISSYGTTVAEEIKNTSENNNGYKVKAIIIIAAVGVVVSLILFITGKKNYKNFIFVGVVVIAGAAFVIFTDIRSSDEYYSGEKISKENSIGTVSIEIRCDTVVGKSESEFIPDDGVILAATDFEIEEGDTVFDILTEAAQTYGIQVENTGSAGHAHGMVYIAGINYLYEYDFGDLSGWVYHVNGISPSRNCGEYVLSDGDVIEWLYTCELGYDLNEVYEE